MAALTPVFTAKQQKQSLSSKKKSNKVTIKNVLATPFSNYWPILNDSDACKLTKTLRENLVLIKPTKINVPWTKLKTLPREERKTFRLKYVKENGTEFNSPDKIDKNAICFSINETTKLLEKNGASCVLVADDINPRLMVKHVIDAAVLKCVPVLVMPGLKKLLLEATGIKSAVVSFKLYNDGSSPYYQIENEVAKLSGQYPVPHNHVNYQRRRLSFNTTNDEVDSVAEEMHTNSNVEEKEQEVPFSYLMRPVTGERAFVPPKVAVVEKTPQTVSEEMPPPSPPSPEVHVSKKAKVESVVVEKRKKMSYKSMLVKRIKPDVNRNQKKIDRLKGK